MNILIVPSWYKTKSNPTLGSFFFEQAKMLNAIGHNVIIADVTLQGRKDYFSGRCYRLIKEEDKGVLVYSYVIPSFGRSNSTDAGWDVTFRNLKLIYARILRDGYKIDIIHAHSYLPAGVAAVHLGNELGIPVVVTEHASDVLNRCLNDKRIELLKYVVSGCNRFICVGNRLKQSVVEMTDCKQKNIQIIPNVVDPIFKYKEEEKIRDDYTFISVGNLVPSKRFDLTIDAFSELYKKFTNIRLNIVGDGPLRKSLEDHVKHLGLTDRIIFYGRINREAVAKLLQESDCFVLPSDYETFGVVYIEALAVGLPVIGTKNGGAEDIITSDNGILVDKNNSTQLSEAMQELYCKLSKYDRKQISYKTSNKYGQKNIGKLLESLYKDLLNMNG